MRTMGLQGAFPTPKKKKTTKTKKEEEVPLER